MKTASFLGVILPQTPVHLVQILNSIFQLPRHTYIQPKFYEDIQLDDERSKPNENDLDLNVANQMKTTWIDQDLRGLSRKYISRKLRVFGVKF